MSHASADLANVRKIRNYLEQRGASPLLFHLLALARPEEFWPIIQREITARTFFLYCESDAAAKSEWVRRERRAVSESARFSAKKIGHIRVDAPELDYSQLDDFISRTRVSMIYAEEDTALIAPFTEQLRKAGFAVVDSGRHSVPLDDFVAELSTTAASGFALLFLSPHSIRNLTLYQEVAFARTLGAKVVPVKLMRDELPDRMEHLLRQADPIFDASKKPQAAPARLVSDLLKY